MKKIFDKHIELVELVNNSKTTDEHYINLALLKGFRSALEIINVNQSCDCDLYYMGNGIDRPMCCGVFLDWTPDTK